MLINMFIPMKKSKMKFLYGGLILMLLGLIVASCSKYPTYTVDTSDYDMVWTQYEENADFGQYQTYYVPDTIFIDSSASEEEIKFLQEYYQSIVEQVVENMGQRGYSRVDSADSPDLGLGITIMTRTNHVYGYSWWYYYPPYWGYPGYSYYYPWATYLGSYEEGALIIDMADLKNANQNNQQINALWAAMIGGVLTNNSGLIDTRLYGYIDQAFDQSPYLMSN